MRMLQICEVDRIFYRRFNSLNWILKQYVLKTESVIDKIKADIKSALIIIDHNQAMLFTSTQRFSQQERAIASSTRETLNPSSKSGYIF